MYVSPFLDRDEKSKGNYEARSIGEGGEGDGGGRNVKRQGKKKSDIRTKRIAEERHEIVTVQGGLLQRDSRNTDSCVKSASKSLEAPLQRATSLLHLGRTSSF